MKVILLIFITAVTFLAKAQTADSVKIYLWPEGAPLAQGMEEADKPSITIYFPEKSKSSGAGVLLCPGGGYVTLALEHEGWQTAKWLNQQGITAAILRYRLGTWDHKKYKHPAMIFDATRAMRLFRSKAKEYGLNPEKIGVMGYSAGGHLASCLSNIYDGGNPKAKDPVERVSSKPNFAILIYPVISLKAKYSFEFGRGVLLGDNADPKSVDSLSTETRVTPLTPSTFLMHTSDDGVKCENSLYYFAALRENNVQGCELHIYERGGHGYGLYPLEKETTKNPERIADWSERLKNWLKNRGVVKDF